MNRYSQLLARRVHALRVARDWTPDELAEAVTKHGVPWSRPIITNIENNRRDNLTVDELFAVAAAFDVAPMTFFVDTTFLVALSVAVEGAELSRDPEFQESLAQMRRGETVPARTALEAARADEADEDGDVPRAE